MKIGKRFGRFFIEGIDADFNPAHIQFLENGFEKVGFRDTQSRDYILIARSYKDFEDLNGIPFASYAEFETYVREALELNEGGGGGGSGLTSVNGDTGPTATVNLDSVIAQPSSIANGVYAVSIVDGEVTLVSASGGGSTGEIKSFASPSSVPSNFLILNGTLTARQEVSKTTYATLYVKIGDFFGTPVDSNNFVLPCGDDVTLKGGNLTDYFQNGGDDLLTIPKLPIVNVNGTISVSTNDGGDSANNGNYFANTSDGNSIFNGFVANGNQNPTVQVQGVNVSFGGNQPHQHPFQKTILAICFEDGASFGSSGESVNIYNSDGFLTSERNVDLVGNELNFIIGDSAGSVNVISDDGSIQAGSSSYPIGFLGFAQENDGLGGFKYSEVSITPYFTRMYFQDTTETSFIQITELGITLTDEIGGRGLRGNFYYGANYDDNTYVQKKYVDDLHYTYLSQTVTSGPSVVVGDTFDEVIVNPGSAIATLELELPLANRNGKKIKFTFGGTIDPGTVVTDLTIIPNSGSSDTILASSLFTNILVEAGDSFELTYDFDNGIWRP